MAGKRRDKIMVTLPKDLERFLNDYSEDNFNDYQEIVQFLITKLRQGEIDLEALKKLSY